MYRSFAIKSSPAQPAYVDVLKENPHGYLVRIRRVQQDYVKESEEFISRQLFEACLRTGYFTEVTTESVAV